jgi:hypothetical protein
MPPLALFSSLPSPSISLPTSLGLTSPSLSHSLSRSGVSPSRSGAHSSHSLSRPGVSRSGGSGVLSRSGGSRLVSRSIEPHTISSPPERSFFGKLFSAISVFGGLQSVLSTISTVWHWVHRHHIKNTALAQYQVDREYWEEQSAEWVAKNRLSRIRMKSIIAIVNPGLFTKKFILSEPEGSEDRKRMAALLKLVNPKSFEILKDQIGEHMDLSEANLLDGESTKVDLDELLFHRPQ